MTCVGCSPTSGPVTAGIDSSTPSVPQMAENTVLGQFIPSKYAENIEKISGS